ncbi:hypothetical protein [Vulcanisaeta thermophila]|uniref:hypothetical protein n=1 Tax=Vulcanisaeta thermophila TaxID=867917 RepID=UPI0008538276|nr:hypothetical protein [Vulcanisaeta thermophila]
MTLGDHVITLFIINEASTVVALSLLNPALPWALIYASSVIASIVVFLVLGGFVNTDVFILSLIPVVLIILFVLNTYGLIYNHISVYMGSLNINVAYFTIFLMASLAILILFLVERVMNVIIRD